MSKILLFGCLAIGLSLLMSPESVRAQGSSIAEFQSYESIMERDTGIPRLHLPKNIPPQATPHNDLVHCSIGYGHASYLAIYLTKSECDAWLKETMAYNQKYGSALMAYDAGQLNSQNAATEARRQEQAGPGKTLIYALFLCFPRTGTCQMQGQARVTFAGVVPDMLFRSLADCEQYAQRATGLITPPTRGRFQMQSGAWMECRGKKIDAWEPLH